MSAIRRVDCNNMTYPQTKGRIFFSGGYFPYVQVELCNDIYKLTGFFAMTLRKLQSILDISRTFHQKLSIILQLNFSFCGHFSLDGAITFDYLR